MGIRVGTPLSVIFTDVGSVPYKINGIFVPSGLYTEAERRVVAAQASSLIRQGDLKNSNNLVQTKEPTDRDKYNLRRIDESTPAKLNEPRRIEAARATFKNEDRRARLEVPKLYLSGPAAGPSAGSNIRTDETGVLYLNSGIVFPYTPRIEMSHSANYRKQNTVHSNYAQHFYAGSEVSDITLTAKFTVQNSFEAQVLLAVQHLGRALTKMAFGNDQTPIAGSPPPVCRLYAHGEYMLDRVPVVVSSFSMAYPDDVNYFTIEENTGYGISSVPIMTTVSMTLKPVYSRNEMLNSSLNGWLTGGQRSQGYL
jgi:hypothetical protein